MNYTQCGSALALPYADGIAQTCVTSPPYYGLRMYLPAGHPSKAAELGTEQTPDCRRHGKVRLRRDLTEDQLRYAAQRLRDAGLLYVPGGDNERKE